MACGFQQIGMLGWYPAEGISGTNFRDRALVAVHTTIVPDLEEQRPVAETVASFDALRATDAKPLVYRVFVIRILDEAAFDSRCRAELVFSTGIQIIWRRFEIPCAQLTIAA
jgi:hypothetical protein